MEPELHGSNNVENAQKQQPSHSFNDDDLMFDLEDGDGFVRKRSPSIDSLCSQGSLGSLVGESSREASEAPQLTAKQTVNSTREDKEYKTSSRSQTQDIPQINFQYSVAPQHDSTWSEQEGRDFSSSLSSVEEATEENLNPTNQRCRRHRRQSVNLDISDTALVVKSPSFLPRFLKASFSKFISKDKSKSAVLRTEPMSLPFFNSMSTPVTRSPSLSLGCSDMSLDSLCGADEKTDNDGCDTSPNTRQFVAESIAKGFPLIPFYYSTVEIVEKKRKARRSKNYTELSSAFSVEDSFSVARERNLSPGRSNIDKDELCNRLSDRELHDLKMENKSLQSLLRMAQREMEEEANGRKISNITGYASNNSRALRRRRSSASEYVGKSYDDSDQGWVEEESRSRHKSKIKAPVKASYSQHDHLAHCSPNMPIGTKEKAQSLDQYLDMKCG